MGKAKHPHDASRPESAGMLKALKIYEETANIDAVYNALTVRQRRFAEEYVLDFVGSFAAVRAGYSELYADRQAHLLLKHKGVSAYIDHLTKTKANKIASVNPELLVQKAMEIVNKEGARDGDKLRGIEMLMRHLGMFVDKQEITGKDGGAIEVAHQKAEQEADEFTRRLKDLAEKSKKEVEII